MDAGVDPERIEVRPNGVAQPASRVARPGALRARLGLDAATPLLLSVGRVADGKGLDLVVELLADIPKAQLAIVGPDDGHGTTRRLEALRQRLGIAERVHLLGSLPHSEVVAAYADADIFVLASAHENFGMVAAEAASAGVPVVVTDRCGVAEFLADAATVVPYDVGAYVTPYARCSRSRSAQRASQRPGGAQRPRSRGRRSCVGRKKSTGRLSTPSGRQPLRNAPRLERRPGRWPDTPNCRR